MFAPRASRRGFSIVELLMVLAVSATIMAVGTPLLRGALTSQRLRVGATEIGNAMSEARRQAFRTSAQARVEVDPADGRISVFAREVTTDQEVELKRYFLPAGIQFVAPTAVTSYAFDALGRPTQQPMQLSIQIEDTTVIRNISVLATGRTTGT
ncbi:prepilin-type N-terminal cleavage/methylation domain-containing protein [Luteitalea sp. TBR-22]|uniref:prepilin-type N-terminal cleavage/methylation domain-containing protein n=1 Tax=Luteitalea sp. TBR-22 TaxID=2802971 RepID=UPI001EF6781B|nr:prepilin-type N-terminal cleavage/methylation domain-containing protein [Luteitalea sp. TBR-22]